MFLFVFYYRDFNIYSESYENFGNTLEIMQSKQILYCMLFYSILFYSIPPLMRSVT